MSDLHRLFKDLISVCDDKLTASAYDMYKRKIEVSLLLYTLHSLIEINPDHVDLITEISSAVIEERFEEDEDEITEYLLHTVKSRGLID